MQQDRYSYQDAGFNAFMLRSRKSNPGAQTVRGGISSGTGPPIAFDRIQVQGSIGDRISVGRLIMDGVAGRLIVQDRNKIEETGWVGDLTD